MKVRYRSIGLVLLITMSANSWADDEIVLDLMLDGAYRRALDSRVNANMTPSNDLQWREKSILEAGKKQCQEHGFDEVVGAPVTKESYELSEEELSAGQDLSPPWKFTLKPEVLSCERRSLFESFGAAAGYGALNLLLGAYATYLFSLPEHRDSLGNFRFSLVEPDVLTRIIGTGGLVIPPLSYFSALEMFKGVAALPCLIRNIKMRDFKVDKKLWADVQKTHFNSQKVIPHLDFKTLKCKGKLNKISEIWLNQAMSNPKVLEKCGLKDLALPKVGDTPSSNQVQGCKAMTGNQPTQSGLSQVPSLKKLLWMSILKEVTE